ncbi:ankyrin repeat-containing domain protein [Bisporella sp. PMI_857]|nr:ankyrin repeat-containing domain protein [Bisporella sp. PMI_857]
MAATLKDKSRAASNALWESHKCTIQDLYIHQDKPLLYVIEYMSREHGFKKTKAQYENVFKKWEFRKNIPEREWKTIAYRIKKRTTEDKQSSIKVGSYNLKASRVQRALYRHNHPQICDPSRAVSEGHSRQDETPPERCSVVVYTPPTNACSLNLASLPWACFLLSVSNYVRSAPPEETARWLDITLATAHYQTQTIAISMDLHRLITRTYTWMPNIPSVLPTIDLPHNLALEKQDRRLELLKMAVYLLSNNLDRADIEDTEGAKDNETIGSIMVQLCRSQDNLSFLKRLLASNQDTIQAMAEKLLVCAVNANDQLLAEILLNAGANPNGKFSGFQYPLAIAILRKNEKLVALLVQRGANVDATSFFGGGKILVNRLFKKFLGYSGSMLHLAIDADQPEILRILLDSNARDYGNNPFCPLATAVLLENIAAVDLLLQYNHEKYWRFLHGRCYEYGGQGNYNYTCLEVAASTGNLQLVKLLFRKGESFDNLLFIGLYKCLPAALWSGSRRLVNYIISKGGSVVDESTDGRSCLAMACESGNMEMVKFLIALRANPNQHSAAELRNELPTPIQIAAYHGNSSIVQLLIDHGANTNGPRFVKPCSWPFRKQLVSTLQAVLLSGDLTTAEILIRAGAYKAEDDVVDIYKPYPWTALQIACSQGWRDIVELFISKGADINEPAKNSKHGATALTVAISSGNTNLVLYLLKSGVNVNSPSKDHPAPSPLQVAAEYARFDITKRLIQLGADIDDSGALWAAVKRNDSRCVAYLISCNLSLLALRRNKINTEMSDYGRAALAQAAANGNRKMVQILLDAGIDVMHAPTQRFSSFATPHRRRKKAPTCHAISMAAQNADYDLIVRLLKYGAPVEVPSHNCSGSESVINYLPLYEPEALRIIDLLTHHGAKLESSILQEAISCRSLDVIYHLLSVGVDINAPAAGHRGRTALQAACEENLEDVLKLLLKKDADVNAPAALHTGATVLQIAVINGNFKILQMLLDAGAELYAQRGKVDGRTAIEGAAESGRLDIVHLLLDQAADIDGGYFEHQLCRAARMAQTEGHFVITKLIRRYQERRFGTSQCQGHERYLVRRYRYNGKDKEVSEHTYDYDSIIYDIDLLEYDLVFRGSDTDSNSSYCSDSDTEYSEIVEDLDIENQDISFERDSSSEVFDIGDDMSFYTEIPPDLEAWMPVVTASDEVQLDLWGELT